MVLGLTGNIGCGKSTVSNILSQKGITIIDLDNISRDIMNDSNTLKLIFRTFGEHLKLKDNTLDRKGLGEIVFNDKSKLDKLNKITHPLIKSRVENILSSKSKSLIVIDGALLIEANFLDIIDRLLLVTCDEKIQIQRVIKRDNISELEANQRINSQMSQQEKINYADYIIDNSYDENKLIENIEEFLRFVKENWSA